MKSIAYEDIRHRPDVIRIKRRMGMVYGMTVGLSFTAATWGIDGFLLSQADAFYPWLKFIFGAVICMTAGGIAGWLVARFEKGLLGLFIYLGLSFVFSWLIVVLPFRIFPMVMRWLDPETGSLLNYTFYEGFNTRFVIAIIWVSLFVALVGVLQLPLTEPAAFSTSFFGKVAPLLVCSVVMFINGVIVDTLNNEPLRTALLHMNNTIEFSAEHQGQEVDRTVARTMRMSSLRAVEPVISQPRKLIVGSYDQFLDQIHVLVRFGNTWVDCVVVYNQPSFCKYVTANSP
ncbi:MAG TPA: hypothetical protein VMN99_08810 [Anaerolineales bacterium]|nr:hypothetical protein [Anaerolineales bacterium]